MKQYIELHPISEKPPTSGVYVCCDENGKNGDVRYYNGRKWVGYTKPTHWLSNEPVTGVLVSEEELKSVVDLLRGYARKVGQSNLLDNLINSLTNKAK
jgi:hypothetical protein